MSKGKLNWTTPPALVLLSGTDDFLRQRDLQKAIQAAQVVNRMVVRVPYGDATRLREFMSTGAVFAQAWLIIVDGAPSKKRGDDGDEAATDDAEGAGAWSADDVAYLADHATNGDPDEYAVVVHQPSEATLKTFAGRIQAAVPRAHHVQRESPKPWKEQEYAVEFLLQELKQHGKTLSPKIAEALIGKVGTDLGVLSFEALKASKYVDAEQTGRTEVVVADIRETMAKLGDDDWSPLIEAVSAADVRRITLVMADIRNGPLHARGAIPAGTVLSGTILRWLRAAAIVASGASPKEAAERLGLRGRNPEWTFNNQYLGPTKRWGVKHLRSLFREVMRLERTAKNGAIDPWIGLETGLIRCCIEAGYRPVPASR